MLSGGLSGLGGAALGVTTGTMTPGAGGLGGKPLEWSDLCFSAISNSKLLLIDSRRGGKAGFSSAGGAAGAGGKGPEIPLLAPDFQSLNLGRGKDSEAVVGSSGKGFDQLSSVAETFDELPFSSLSFSISLGRGARKFGRKALLVFLYLSIKVTGAQPSLSSIWIYHQPLAFFSITWWAKYHSF